MQLPSQVESIRFRGIECYRLVAGAGSAIVSAIVSRFGAQVLSWRDSAGRERLFLSERAIFDGRTPIRGGIPLCFPQFSGLGDLPKHGFVRSRLWDLAAAHADDGLVSLALRTGDDAGTRALWPHAFELLLEVKLHAEHVQVGLTVRNNGSTPFAFTGALHTYFAVGDIAATTLTGLNGLEYRDAAGGNAIRIETETSLIVGQEVDRVYHRAQRPLSLDDGGAQLAVAAAGFTDVVVWNPWQMLCAQLSDMQPQAYRQMLCVEAAVAQFPVSVAAAGVWSGSQKLMPCGPRSRGAVDGQARRSFQLSQMTRQLAA